MNLEPPLYKRQVKAKSLESRCKFQPIKFQYLIFAANRYLQSIGRPLRLFVFRMLKVGTAEDSQWTGGLKDVNY
ncbi:MAG: hypothetical protein ACFFGZ_14610 [Candidatus Thorarchaeota archaeon]